MVLRYHSDLASLLHFHRVIIDSLILTVTQAFVLFEVDQSSLFLK